MSLSKAARQIDSLLRGGFTQKEKLEAGRVELPVASMVLASLLLGAVYGICMGLFAVLREENPSSPQLLATTVKVPLLFLATLVVTFPSLYVFSALARSRLEASSTLKLLLAAVTVNLAVLASFGPVTGFFTLSTDSYSFMVLLSVTFFLVSGCVGLGFLSRALDRVFFSEDEDREAAQESAAKAAAVADPVAAARSAARPFDEKGSFQRKSPAASVRPGRNIMRVWVAIYAVVGAQMAWIMRPFIGAPGIEFSFFRERGGNFLKALLETLAGLLG